MAALRVPVSVEIYQWVKARAKRNGRSMSAEAAAVIEEALGVTPAPRLAAKPQATRESRASDEE
jgi:plasmid stability protein